VSGQGDTLIVSLSEAERSATDDRTMQQSVEIVRRRVDEAGTREPTIQRQGADRILIQVPGIGSGAGAEGPDRHHRAADLPAGGGPRRQRR
jgi:preprotein translocase subunit SecD